MPIISVGIVNKQGKIVLSRQFADISRIRIEGLLSAFPRLLSSNPGSKQVTFIETGSVRYVYQPLENLIMVLVTTKGSNIVEDLATLRLMGRLVPEYTPVLDEEHIAERAFDILFAFDEVVVNGHRDNNTLEQILTYLAMQSHEEEMAKEEKRQQELAAKQLAKQRAAQIKLQKQQGMIPGGGIGSSGGSYGGIGGDSIGGGMGGGDMGGMSSGSIPPTQALNTAVEAPAPKKSTGAGMSLGKTRKTDVASRVLMETGGSAAAAASAPQPDTTVAPGATQQQGAIHIKVDERISATLNRDGGLTGLDVRGDMSIHIADASLANVRVQLKPYNEDFTFKTHSKINKELFTSSRVLTVKDGKSYATHQTLEIVRWRAQNASKSIKTPIAVNCWPSEKSANVEYELENTALTLRNVVIWIPVGRSSPTIDDCSEGSVDVEGDYVRWTISEVTASNSSGSIEMNFPGALDTAAYFPMKVSFCADVSLANVAVADVVNAENGMPAPFTTETSLSTDEYIVA